jgi:SAM-dependent methyltransferase
MTTELMPRTAIDEIVAHRGAALAGYAAAFDAVADANRHAATAAPGQIYSSPSVRMDSKQWRQDREELLKEARENLDRGIWRHLMSRTNFDQLMDKTARDALRAQLEKEPPEVTVETALATMAQLFEDRDLIFKRGVAAAFSALDRRFRSHDGFKIGSRVVLTYCFSGGGFWNHYRHHDDTLMDLERTFALIEGRSPPAREEGIMGKADEARREAQRCSGSLVGGVPFTVETDLFKLVAYKNGNAHLWFKRDDLLKKVNQLLADYYGKALAAGFEAAQRDRQHEPIRTPAKNFGFWETPEAVARQLLDAAEVHLPERRGRWADDPPGYTVLEPSCGKGALVRLIQQAPGAQAVGIEIQPHLAQHVRETCQVPVHEGDFLTMTPATYGRFDRIVMNPPFDGTRDVDHVRHAFKFLKPGGYLASVMSAGVEFREDRKTADFRAWVEGLGGRFTDLPPESFAASGTRVNTVIVRLQGPRA